MFAIDCQRRLIMALSLLTEDVKNDENKDSMDVQKRSGALDADESITTTELRLF